jgi:hypothetical protein
MKKFDWNNITAKAPDEFSLPEPGGYIAQITAVEDREDKEYILVEWEFASGQYKGDNGKTYSRAGFWPAPYYASYKGDNIAYFKHFKNAVEFSNRGYTFNEDNIQSLRGKFFGVIVTQEEYQNSKGEIKNSLKAKNCVSVQDIQTGNFKVPKKKLFSGSTPASAPSYASPAPTADPFTSANPFQDMTQDKEPLPF